MTFAIIETGGKQYRVEPGQKLRIEKLSAAAGGGVIFDKVLFVSEDGAVKIGMPYIAGATVKASRAKEERGRKTIVFKYHSKTRYRKKAGHRQHFTEVKIIDIS